MKNGQLKAGYNVQISTEKQIIVNYSIHQTSNDLTTLKFHLNQFKTLYGEEQFQQIENITADAGYGSCENYEYLEEQDITAYIKYPSFDQERKCKNSRTKQQNLKDRQNLYYNEVEDYYVCPMGQRMTKVGEKQTKSTTGYIQQISLYEAQRCEGCPLRGSCHSARGNRRIERSHQLEGYRLAIRERLLSEPGIIQRKRRSIEVEPVFGHIKSNRNFKRFTMRGLKMVDLEFGLHALAHNMRKMAA